MSGTPSSARHIFLFVSILIFLSLCSGCAAHVPVANRKDTKVLSRAATDNTATDASYASETEKKQGPEKSKRDYTPSDVGNNPAKEKVQHISTTNNHLLAKKQGVARGKAYKRRDLLSSFDHIRHATGKTGDISNDSADIKGYKDTDKGQVVINFDDADLSEAIKTVADMLGINYIMEPGITGKVSIHTSGALKKADLLPVFFRILDLNNLTAIRHGNLYTIVHLKKAGTSSAQPRYGTDERGLRQINGERVIIQIIPLNYISSEEMVKVLTPFISSKGTILSNRTPNTLIIADKASNILKALKIIRSFDINLFDQVQYRFFPIKNMGIKDVVSVLKEAFSSDILSGKAKVKFIPLEALNMVLSVSSDTDVLNRIGIFINRLNMDMGEAETRLFVYFVKNGKADQLSELLNQVFVSDTSGKTTKKGTSERLAKESRNPFAINKKKKASEKHTRSKTSTLKGTGSHTLRKQVKITPDADRNALIIEATPGDYAVVRNILNSLDVLPRQVLIECTIAEITLDNKTDLGIEWSYSKGDADRIGTGTLEATIGEGGLNYIVGMAHRIKADISAFASEGKVRILSSPHILASDNKEAKIDISNEVPVASSSYQYTNEKDVISTNIEYRDTGIILSVTPHINSNGIVTMDIDQEVSKQAPDVLVAGKSYPSFAKRHLNTSLTVKDGQTIVLGGLISSEANNTDKGTPWIVDIPVLRYLFGKESRTDKKVELIVLLTPRVVTSLNDVDTITKEFKIKVRNATKMLDSNNQ